MNLLVAENLTKTYGEKVLLQDVSVGIEEGERIGLVGVNGTGKSTFLKILAQLDKADGGTVTTGNAVRVEYLPQDPAFDERATVLQQVFKGNSPTMQLLREYEQALERQSADPHNQALQERLLALSQQMEAKQVWQIEAEAKTILAKLGIKDVSSPMGSLSGGQRKRVALAGALITPSELLILDEPTNHLDSETISWLEQYLLRRRGALLMITHDRYFLDRVVTRILELDKGRLYSYDGHYTEFLAAKAEREEQQRSSEQKRQNLYRNELAWIRRGAKARTTKQKARIDRFEKLVAEKVELRDESLEMPVGATRLGRKVIELSDVTKEYADQKVIDRFSYIFGRGERIGIIGPNGAGKSTLLKLIACRLAPDQGSVETGETVKVGWFGQENTEMKHEMRVIEYIREVAEFIPSPDGGVITAAQMLERFLFPPHLQWTPIGRLSGGEKRRVYLLHVLMGAPNVLILDEPTNDLDVQTLAVLEDYLDDFPGTVIAVSHDRYFLDRMAEKIFALKGEGTVNVSVGNFTDYEERLQEEAGAAKDRKDEPAQGAGKGKARIEKMDGKSGTVDAAQNDSRENSGTNEKSSRPLKFTYKEKIEYEQIEEQIAQAEQELQAVREKINAAGSNYVQLQELMQEQSQQELRVEELVERWAYLQELAERIAETNGKSG
ncbi:ATP-binding cassette domain-containing protein [Heliobacillus mobilis]|uniref:ATP-binding cassette domain-containing protein n=2 Tax=Heliobacterium mobile TaxID=28064 RepID=A0A6I3SP69_HELMO|nr:ABC-F family ATP-binding cassette domain-containing protein [Heliobacterium mobile]MTV50818.1 ATP-binding cassette domain-containing protein [Heliobacterium mobile]